MPTTPSAPALVEQRDAGGAVVDGHRFEQMQGLLLHVGLDFTAFAIEIVELLGDGQGAGRIVGEQGFDAQGACRPGGRRR